MTLTANEIDCGILRVSTKKIKQELGQATKGILNKILEKTYETAVKRMKSVYEIYVKLEEDLMRVPANEKEYSELAMALDQTQNLVNSNQKSLKTVEKYFAMLDEFQFIYKEIDIESFWFMKIWPLKI